LSYDRPTRRGFKNGALGRNTVEQLFIGLACYFLIWLVVLWGSRYFGPNAH
jgi:hypothetical protein